ncbi:hypothetical protein [Brucella pituitosa]|uniref:hypothetical protein n=1 Tax=Brucella pituitosa TaxID=571256 RepID=UPI0013E3AA07|nr:hypothetical protein [Brucella pituitosa]
MITDKLSRDEIIKARREIEQYLKDNPHVPTRRYLDEKDAELYEELERLEKQGIAA